MILGQAESDTAMTLLQYGAIGACLVISVIFNYLQYKGSQKKDDRIDKINENRVEAAMKAVQAIAIQAEKLQAIIELTKETNESLQKVALKLESLKFKRGDSDA